MTLIEKVQYAISKNKVKDAFELLKAAAKATNETNFSNALAIHERHYTELKTNLLKGIETDNDKVRLSVICDKLLTLASKIMEELPSTPNIAAEQQVPNSNNLPQQATISKITIGNNTGQINYIENMNAPIQQYQTFNQTDNHTHQTVNQSSINQAYSLSLLQILKNDASVQHYLNDLQPELHTTERILETNPSDGRTQFASLLTNILQRYTTDLETNNAGLSKNTLQLLLNQVSNLKTLALSTSNDRAEIGTQLQSIAYSIRRRETQADDLTALLHLVGLFEQWNKNFIK
ncbi:MAG: hypothetical protein ACK4TA_08680 [Saprospiraceae bacterium]